MSNFFKHYLDYSENSEPTSIFHLWSAIGALSALVGKKIHLPHGYFDIYPNLYIVLVGTAASRKSSALNIAKGIVQCFPDIPLAPSSASKESIIDIMSDSKINYTHSGKELYYSQLSAFANEFDTFMGGNHLNRGIASLLTDIWDELSFKEKTRSHGSKVILNPYLTVLGACVPEWFRTQVREQIISSGFTRRFIFVYGERTKKNIAIPTLDNTNLEAWDSLLAEANRVHGLCGTYTMTPATIAAHTEFYNELQNSIPAIDIRYQNYYSSKHALVLKVAMLISAGISSNRIITLPVYRFTLNLFEETERALPKIYNNIGNNPLIGVSESIKDFVKKYRKVSRKQILKTFYSDLQQGQKSLDQILSELTQMGYLSAPEVSPNGVEILYSSLEEGQKSQGQDLLEQASLLTHPASDLVATPLPDLPPRVVVQVLEQVAKQANDVRRAVAADPILKGILDPKSSSQGSSQPSLVSPKPCSVKDTPQPL